MTVRQICLPSQQGNVAIHRAPDENGVLAIVLTSRVAHTVWGVYNSKRRLITKTLYYKPDIRLSLTVLFLRATCSACGMEWNAL